MCIYVEISVISSSDSLVHHDCESGFSQQPGKYGMIWKNMKIVTFAIFCCFFFNLDHQLCFIIN